MEEPAEMTHCAALDEALKSKPFFDVSGGCGVDMSKGGDGHCMEASGVWFKYCPFCGKKITSSYNGRHWDWWEDQ